MWLNKKTNIILRKKSDKFSIWYKYLLEIVFSKLTKFLYDKSDYNILEIQSDIFDYLCKTFDSANHKEIMHIFPNS